MGEQNSTLTKEARKKEQIAKLRRFFRVMFSRRIVIIGAVGTAFFVLMAIFAPLLTPYDPNEILKDGLLQPFSAAHPLGTDYLGRDLWARIVFGARVSLLTGVIATLIGTAIGTLLGMLAAYYGGAVDKFLIGCCETFNAIPQIALSMTLITLFGGGMLNMAFILCLGGIWGALRMMRASSLAIMNNDYITAAKLSGENKLKLMYKHVFPNAISPIIVSATQSVGGTIMMEAGLSFLGVGIKVPTASWGSIINEARPYLMAFPSYVLAPCVCLALLIISLNLLGDGIRDALDPSLRGES